MVNKDIQSLDIQWEAKYTCKESTVGSKSLSTRDAVKEAPVVAQISIVVTTPRKFFSATE